MAGVVYDRFHDLHNMTAVHDKNAVGNLIENRKVVGDKDPEPIIPCSRSSSRRLAANLWELTSRAEVISSAMTSWGLRMVEITMITAVSYP